MLETGLLSLDQEEPLQEGMAIHSRILASRIPWTDEVGRLQSMGSQRIGYDWSDWACRYALYNILMAVFGIKILVMLQVHLELILYLLHFNMEILLPYRSLYTLMLQLSYFYVHWKPPENSVFSFSTVKHVLRNSTTQCYFEFSGPFLTPLLLFFPPKCQLGGPYVFFRIQNNTAGF